MGEDKIKKIPGNKSSQGSLKASPGIEPGDNDFLARLKQMELVFYIGNSFKGNFKSIQVPLELLSIAMP